MCFSLKSTQTFFILFYLILVKKSTNVSFHPIPMSNLLMALPMPSCQPHHLWTREFQNLKNNYRTFIRKTHKTSTIK